MIKYAIEKSNAPNLLRLIGKTPSQTEITIDMSPSSTLLRKSPENKARNLSLKTKFFNKVKKNALKKRRRSCCCKWCGGMSKIEENLDKKIFENKIFDFKDGKAIHQNPRQNTKKATYHAVSLAMRMMMRRNPGVRTSIDVKSNSPGLHPLHPLRRQSSKLDMQSNSPRRNSRKSSTSIHGNENKESNHPHSKFEKDNHGGSHKLERDSANSSAYKFDREKIAETNESIQKTEIHSHSLSEPVTQKKLVIPSMESSVVKKVIRKIYTKGISKIASLPSKIDETGRESKEPYMLQDPKPFKQTPPSKTRSPTRARSIKESPIKRVQTSHQNMKPREHLKLSLSNSSKDLLSIYKNKSELNLFKRESSKQGKRSMASTFNLAPIPLTTLSAYSKKISQDIFTDRTPDKLSLPTELSPIKLSSDTTTQKNSSPKKITVKHNKFVLENAFKVYS